MIIFCILIWKPEKECSSSLIQISPRRQECRFAVFCVSSHHNPIPLCCFLSYTDGLQTALELCVYPLLTTRLWIGQGAIEEDGRGLNIPHVWEGYKHPHPYTEPTVYHVVKKGHFHSRKTDLATLSWLRRDIVRNVLYAPKHHGFEVYQAWISIFKLYAQPLSSIAQTSSEITRSQTIPQYHPYEIRKKSKVTGHALPSWDKRRKVREHLDLEIQIRLQSVLADGVQPHPGANHGVLCISQELVWRSRRTYIGSKD